MSTFFDEYVDIGASGGAWITTDEKRVLMEEGIPFQITGIADDDENRYGPRFVAFVVVPDPETGEDAERKLGFPKVVRDAEGNIEGGVESRDRMLNAMKHGEGSYPGLDNGGDPITVKLEKVGRAIIIRQA